MREQYNILLKEHTLTRLPFKSCKLVNISGADSSCILIHSIIQQLCAFEPCAQHTPICIKVKFHFGCKHAEKNKCCFKDTSSDNSNEEAMTLVFTPFEISRHVASGLRREGKTEYGRQDSRLECWLNNATTEIFTHFCFSGER